MEIRPSWGGVIFFFESFRHLIFFGMRARATAEPPEACSCIRLPWDRLVRVLKSKAAKGSLTVMSKPVTIPVELPLAILWPTGMKGVRSGLVELIKRQHQQISVGLKKNQKKTEVESRLANTEIDFCHLSERNL